ncbi:MAG: c-type cytochrome [Chitinophagaceae bacterium]|nr:c-type cytochrome [Chitinophagaceae bacterium]
MKATATLKILSVLLLICTILILNSTGQVRSDEPPKPQNLKVLPKDISHDELIKTMRNFSTALGVKCIECHVGTPTADGKMDFDFASDTKPEKTTAREMMRMVTAINSKYIGKMKDDKLERITCVTCHRGSTKPMVNVDSLPGHSQH